MTDRADRFAAIYRATRSEILAYLLRRVPQREDAADLLAEVYLVAWRRLDEIPTDIEARLWLYGVAQRVLANYRRDGRVAQAGADRLRNQLLVTAGANPAAVGTDPAAVAVHEALAGLDAGQRELLTLTAWEGLTPSEIASLTRQTPGAVRVRLHRARGQLRLRLARAEIDTEDPLQLVIAQAGP